MAALLGVVALALVLFTIGAVMEQNLIKAAKFGAALAVCAGLIIMIDDPRPLSDEDCWIDWDGRTNATVCD